MDNAPYHSVLLEKPPTNSWWKYEIIAWLHEKGFPFIEGSTKAELLNLTIANTSWRKKWCNLINSSLTTEQSIVGVGCLLFYSEPHHEELQYVFNCMSVFSELYKFM
jgi:lambda repressor-like predicted transcriptional regulator